MENRFPFPAYPNGWFRAAYTSELAEGDVLSLRYFGEDLVLYRSRSGTPFLLDAHCRHLGAHLGVGGSVEGEHIRCPFHGWKWAGDGACAEIPYCERIPPGAKIRSWPLVEKNGVIFVWHHDRGEPPSFEVPDLAEIGADDWTPLEVRKWKVRSRWLDMNENAVDRIHFVYVHGTHTAPETDVEVNDHILSCRSRMKMGSPKGEFTGGIDTTDFGPGLQTVRVTGVVDTLMLNTSTPIDEEYTDVSFAYSLFKPDGGDANAGVGAAIIKDLEKQMAQDIPIWENKKYFDRPVLCEQDGQFGVYRKWMRQFFSADW